MHVAMDAGMMLSRACWLALVIWVLRAAVLPSAGSACSPARHCRAFDRVQPIDGAIEVPRNIELRISYTKPDRYNDNMRGLLPVLETAAGEVVPTTWEVATSPHQEMLVGLPTTPLAASTEYRLRHPFRACGEVDAGPYANAYCTGGLCADEVGAVISEFTTGASGVERMLAAPVLGSELQKSVDVCEHGACCGPYARCLFYVGAPALEPGQMFRVARGDALVAYVPSKEHLVANVGSAFNWNTDFSGAGDFDVSVVDAVGNRSPSTTLRIPECVIPPGTGGRPGLPDGGVVAPDASRDESSPGDASGCALGATGSGGWMALAWLAARRRQRTRR